MKTFLPFLMAVAVLLQIGLSPARSAETPAALSTRITDPKQHHRQGPKSYPYRRHADHIVAVLDLRPGDVVVDIGAGDGWWSERLAAFVGEAGKVHAAEVAEKKVDQMKTRFADNPRVHPYICPTDGTGLAEDSCDLAFFSQSFHHLDKESRGAYLKHLGEVLRPTGRVAIIEKYTEVGLGSGTHGTRLSTLLHEAEEAGWIPVRVDLLPGTYHYLAVFARKDLFPPEPKSGNKGKKANPN